MKPLPYISLIFILAVFIGVLTGCTLTVSIKGVEKSKVAEPIKVEEEKAVEVKGVKVKKSNYQTIKDAHNQEWDNLPQLPAPYSFKPKEGSMYQDSKGNWVTYHENGKKDSIK